MLTLIVSSLPGRDRMWIIALRRADSLIHVRFWHGPVRWTAIRRYSPLSKEYTIYTGHNNIIICVQLPFKYYIGAIARSRKSKCLELPGPCAVSRYALLYVANHTLNADDVCNCLCATNTIIWCMSARVIYYLLL